MNEITFLLEMELAHPNCRQVVEWSPTVCQLVSTNNCAIITLKRLVSQSTYLSGTPATYACNWYLQ